MTVPNSNTCPLWPANLTLLRPKRHALLRKSCLRLRLDIRKDGGNLSDTFTDEQHYSDSSIEEYVV